MKTYKDLTKEQKELVNEIVNQAMEIVENEGCGNEFVRINLYPSAVEAYKKGEKEVELVAAHYFSNSKWDDIDKYDQVEIFSFEQDPNLEDDWEDTYYGEKWVYESREAIEETVIDYLFNS